MRAKRAMYSIIVSGIQQVILMILGLILPRLYISTYGSELNGLISSIKQFLGYFMIAGAGIGSASIAALFKPIGEQNTKNINKVLSATRIFYRKSCYIFVSLVIVLGIIYPFLVQDSISSGLVTSLVIILGVGSTIEQFITAKYTVLLMADQKAYISSAVQTISNILNAMCIIVLIKLNCGIIYTQFMATSVIIIKFIIIKKYILKHYPYVDYKMESDMSYIENRWQAFFYQISSMILSYSPIVIITIYCGLVEVSVYSIYNLIFSSLAMIVGIFSFGLTSGFGDMLAKKEYNNLKKNFNLYEFFYYLIIAIIYSTTFLLLDSFIGIYTFGIEDALYVRPIFGLLFIVSSVLKNVKTPHLTLIDAGGYFKENNKENLIEATLAIVSSLLLVNKMKMNGVLIGLCMGYSYRIIKYIIFTRSNILKDKDARESVKYILTNLILAIFAILLCKYLINYEIYTFIEWVIIAILTIIIISFVLIIGNIIINKNSIIQLYNRFIRVLR